MAIDVGAAATDRASSLSIHNRTRVGKENPANAAGTIDTLEIWLFSSTSPDVWVGSFSFAGDVGTCRDSESVGDVTAGSKQTFSGLDIDVETGDYWGTHAKTGSANVEKDDSGSGYWNYNGEVIDPSDSQTFTSVADKTLSLYGTGTEAAVAGIGAYSHMLNPLGINKYGPRIG